MAAGIRWRLQRASYPSQTRKSGACRHLQHRS
jgi:hypothetical protein